MYRGKLELEFIAVLVAVDMEDFCCHPFGVVETELVFVLKGVKEVASYLSDSLISSGVRGDVEVSTRTFLRDTLTSKDVEYPAFYPPNKANYALMEALFLDALTKFPIQSLVTIIRNTDSQRHNELSFKN